MPAGYLSKSTGTDIDNSFDFYVSGTKAATSKYFAKDTGQQLSDRYAPYAGGVKAPLTGYIEPDGQDIREKYAAKGTSFFLISPPTWINTGVILVANAYAETPPPPAPDPLIIPGTWGGTGARVTNSI